MLTLQRQGLPRARQASQLLLSPNWYLSDPSFFQQSVIVTQVATWKIRVLFCVLIQGSTYPAPHPEDDKEYSGLLFVGLP
ncbi:hypothetical protein ACC761_39610 [Rhizobium ruizarguesonis]